VSHPVFWVDGHGNSPKPFTPLTYEDFMNGMLRPRFSQYNDEVEKYLKGLKDGNRYVHMIWPPHCLIGSDESIVMPVLYDEIHKWEEESPGAFIDYVTKGSNYLREHYSAVKAEVEDPRDPTTKLNMKLIQTLENSDEILIAGEALEYCVANTIRDITDNFNSSLQKFIILEDTTSEVQKGSALGAAFMADMKAKGIRTCKTTDYSVY
jgi:nicotinamidase-related amidase